MPHKDSQGSGPNLNNVSAGGSEKDALSRWVLSQLQTRLSEWLKE